MRVTRKLALRAQVGGIRRIVVPVELGYPDNDYRKQGPKPSTFSGERALGFVLSNQGAWCRLFLRRRCRPCCLLPHTPSLLLLLLLHTKA